MNRILLADDSPHAQRMGERILREEGYEVISVTDGETALVRMADVDPDVVVADMFLPSRSGFDLCRHIKERKELRHTRVVLTAGLLEPFDQKEVRESGCDAVLRKPFEASAVVETIQPLMEAAHFARGLFGEAVAETQAAVAGAVAKTLAEYEPPPPDPERVHAAVTLALNAAMPRMVEEITERVMVALGH